jgi:hypothetical protein
VSADPSESQYHRRSDTVLFENHQPIRLCKCGCPHTGTVNIGGGGVFGGEGEKWMVVLFLGRCDACRCQSYKMSDGRKKP